MRRPGEKEYKKEPSLAIQQGTLSDLKTESYLDCQYAAILEDLLQKAREESENTLVEEIMSEMCRLESSPMANSPPLSSMAVNRTIYSLPPPSVRHELEEKAGIGAEFGAGRVVLSGAGRGTGSDSSRREGDGVPSSCREQNLKAMEGITQSMKESMWRMSERIRADEKRLEEAQSAQMKNFDAVGSANKANMRFLVSQKLQIFVILKQLVLASLLLVLALYLL